MANMLNPNKERIVYAEWTDVRDELAKLRAEMSEKEGREISEAEFLRQMTLQAINKRRKAKGQKPLDLSPESNPQDRH